jgi:hypothetical protein
MTYDTHLVAFGVSKISAIVVGVILGSYPRRTLRSASIRQGNGIGFIDDSSAAGKEGDHLSVPDLVRRFIVRRSDEE